MSAELDYPLSKDWGDVVVFGETEADRIVEDFVFVPVANDGNIFNPSLWRKGKFHDGGYTIGAKGAERVVPDFDEALELLRKMETPRWRRPNPESGNWGIVSGQTWRRVRMSDLEPPCKAPEHFDLRAANDSRSVLGSPTRRLS